MLKTNILSHVIQDAKELPRRLERTQHQRRADGLVRLNKLMAKSQGYPGTNGVRNATRKG